MTRYNILGKQTLIILKNVSKTYFLGELNYKNFFAIFKYIFFKKKDYRLKEKKALIDINLNIKKGERVALLGRNGSGKSTLLKIISNITAPTSGYLKINGKVMSLLEVGLGFHPELTCKDNIILNGLILGVNKKKIYKSINSIIDFADLTEYADTPLKRYSSGMIAKLGITIGIYLRSDILIVDEIFATADTTFRKKCIKKILEFNKYFGRVIILVSHNLDLVSKICLRGIVLNSGKISYDGKIKNAIHFYKKKI